MLGRRDQRRSFYIFVVVVLSLFAIIIYNTNTVSKSLGTPRWLKGGNDQASWQEENDDMEEYPPWHSNNRPSSDSHHNPNTPASSDPTPSGGMGDSRIVKTNIETIIPSAPHPSDPSVRIGAHTHGFTVFDRLYLRNGTFYVVTTDENFPPRRNLISKPFDTGTGIDLEPTDEDMQFIHPSKAQEVLGDFATVVPGFTVFLHDPAQFMHHFYHWWGEIILGLWRVYSVLGLGKPDYVRGKTPHLPFPSRFVMPVVEGNEWRDRAGVDGPLMRAAFPNAAIEKSDYWADLKGLQMTFVFERSMIVNRETAHRHPFGGRWFKMIAGTMNATVPDRYWEPVRHAILENMIGYVPEVDEDGHLLTSSLSFLGSKPPPPAPAAAPQSKGSGKEKPVVIYISRQGAGRKLVHDDHELLVESLKGLEREGICTVEVAMMERLSVKEQLALDARSTIMVGVHGNGLTHQMFMPPSRRSTVFEILDPPSYVFDYEMLARNMGHKHYAVHNDTLITYPKGEYNEGVQYTDEFHGDSIPAYGPAIADMIRKRLTDLGRDLED